MNSWTKILISCNLWTIIYYYHIPKLVLLISDDVHRKILLIFRYAKRRNMHDKRHQFVLFPELHYATFNVNKQNGYLEMRTIILSTFFRKALKCCKFEVNTTGKHARYHIFTVAHSFILLSYRKISYNRSLTHALTDRLLIWAPCSLGTARENDKSACLLQFSSPFITK